MVSFAKRLAKRIIKGDNKSNYYRFDGEMELWPK